jgi:hypothetical protein
MPGLVPGIHVFKAHHEGTKVEKATKDKFSFVFFVAFVPSWLIFFFG